MYNTVQYSRSTMNVDSITFIGSVDYVKYTVSYSRQDS